MNNIDLYSLFRLSPVPMWTFDTETLRFLDVNIAATTSYGYSKEEFLSMTINEIRPEEDVDWVKNIVKENFIKGALYQNTLRHLRRNGEMIYVDIASNLISMGEKGIRLVMAIDVTEKLKAQQALMMNEKRFIALVQDGSDLITILDSNFKYTYVSPASIRVFGIEPELFIGRDAFEFIHRDDRQKLELESARIWVDKHVELSPYRYRDLSGNWLWIETRATNLLDDPAVEGIVCTSKDISERVLNEKLIQESIERFKMVSKATSDIIWDCNLINDTIFWNKAIKGLLKYNVEITSIDWWKEKIQERDRMQVIASLDEHIALGIEKWEAEYLFLCGDGIYRHIFDRGFILRNDQGVVYRMIGAMQDITQRKQDEHWSKLLESVVVNTTDGVLITNHASQPKIIYVNDAMLKMSGYAREDLIGKSPEILHGHQSDQTEITYLKRAIEGKYATKTELINYTKTNLRYDVSISLTPIFDDGQLSSWISIQRDVSEQRKYMNDIEAQNKKLNEISWMQSHVARAPLARIMSLAELLEDSSKKERPELILHLKNSAAELDQIITAIANQTMLSNK